MLTGDGVRCAELKARASQRRRPRNARRGSSIRRHSTLGSRSFYARGAWANLRSFLGHSLALGPACRFWATVSFLGRPRGHRSSILRRSPGVRLRWARSCADFVCCGRHILASRFTSRFVSFDFRLSLSHSLCNYLVDSLFCFTSHSGYAETTTKTFAYAEPNGIVQETIKSDIRYDGARTANQKQDTMNNIRSAR